MEGRKKTSARVFSSLFVFACQYKLTNESLFAIMPMKLENEHVDKHLTYIHDCAFGVAQPRAQSGDPTSIA
jgi:hypothetical protein